MQIVYFLIDIFDSMLMSGTDNHAKKSPDMPFCIQGIFLLYYI